MRARTTTDDQRGNGSAELAEYLGNEIDVARFARGEGDLEVEHVLRHGILVRVERAFEGLQRRDVLRLHCAVDFYGDGFGGAGREEGRDHRLDLLALVLRQCHAPPLAEGIE